MSNQIRVLKLVDSWYIETAMGYEGPFDSYDEAVAFLDLSQTADAARMEFAGLAFSLS